MLFSNVKLAEPPASLFAVPSGYTAHDDQQSLMQSVMAKAMQGLVGK
jgi:hypothetical protein